MRKYKFHYRTALKKGVVNVDAYDFTEAVTLLFKHSKHRGFRTFYVEFN